MSMMVHTASDALRSGRVLELHYEGYNRAVEGLPPSVSTRTTILSRVSWRVSGGRNEPVGWKLLRLDEPRGAAITDQDAKAPREELQTRRS